MSTPLAIHPLSNESERNWPHQNPKTSTLSTSCAILMRAFPLNFIEAITPKSRTSMVAKVFVMPIVGYWAICPCALDCALRLC